MKTTGYGIMILLLAAGAAGATTYYVSSSGNDSNDGTSEVTAWATPNKAGDVMVAGDTVLIMDGTYLLAEKILPANSGTAGNPITYKAYPGTQPVIDGGSTSIADGVGCFGLGGLAYITVEGLHVTRGNTCNVGFYRGDHIVIENCLLTGSTGDPSVANNESTIRCMNGPAPACVIRNCTIDSTGSSKCGLLTYGAEDWVVENNEIFGGTQHALFNKCDGLRNLWRRNIIHDFGSRAIYYYDGWGANTGNVACENIVYNVGFGLDIGLSVSDGAVQHVGPEVYNNTFFNCDTMAVVIENGEATRTGVKVYNNIFCNTTSDSDRYVLVNNMTAGMDVEIHNNCWYQSSAPASPFRYANVNYNFAGWQGLGFGGGTTTADPQFVDAGTDFHLAAGSPCAGTGASGLDMGAYPHGDNGTEPDTTPPAVPTGLSGDRDSDTSVAITWDPVPDADLAGYTVSYATESGVYSGVQDVTGTNGWILAGLDPDETYYISVVAFDETGNRSDPSTEIVVNMKTGEVMDNDDGSDHDGSADTRSIRQDDEEAAVATKGILVKNTLQDQSLPLTILVKDRAGAADGLIEIFNVSGALVATVEAAAAGGGLLACSVDTASYPNGLYFLYTSSGTELFTGSFIVAR